MKNKLSLSEQLRIEKERLERTAIPPKRTGMRGAIKGAMQTSTVKINIKNDIHALIVKVPKIVGIQLKNKAMQEGKSMRQTVTEIIANYFDDKGAS